MTQPDQHLSTAADAASDDVAAAAGVAAARESQVADDGRAADAGPQSVPPRIWVTLVGFAAFVILFGTCAANWMFG